jgi:cell division protein FtsX
MKVNRAALSLVLAVSYTAGGRTASAWTASANHHHRFAAQRLLAIQLHSSSSTAASSLTTEVEGQEATESFRLAFKDESSKKISPWHDIPLKNDDGSFNMVRSFLT